MGFFVGLSFWVIFGVLASFEMFGWVVGIFGWSVELINVTELYNSSSNSICGLFYLQSDFLVFLVPLSVHFLG